MYKSLGVFKDNLNSAQELLTLYDYLAANIKVPMSFDDLLRLHMVQSVSAFDKLMHDIIRIGIVDIFIGARPVTKKYLNEPISMSTHNSLSAATIPPKEYFFEQAIVSKLSYISYQAPDIIADGLSYIWNVKHKWDQIAAAMSMKAEDAKRQLRLIVSRRNQIVHEADIELTTGGKRPIAKNDCETSILFIGKLGEQIVRLVA